MLDLFVRFFALIGLLFLTPLILIAIILVFLEDGRPVLFIQKRLGKNEEEFNLFKIRTMYNETPELGTHEIGRENYLTSGKVLRDLKIDELPQIVNYLFGHINLVGPRPGLPNQKELLEFRRKNNVFATKPGITGMGQILGFDMSNPALLAKIDALYILNRSTKLDLRILIATFVKKYRLKIYDEFKNDIKFIKEGTYV